MSDNMDEFAVDDLELAILDVRNRHNTRMMEMEFNGFMKKLTRLSHDQKVTLYNALVTQLAGVT